MLQVHEAPPKSVWPALCAGLLAAAAAYVLLAWVLEIQSLRAPPTSAPVAQNAPSLVGNSEPAPGVAVALGAASTTDQAGNSNAKAAHQWALIGVVASASGQGAALLAVDGQAAKAFLPGQTIAPGWVLHSVGPRLARLALSMQDAPSVTLALPQAGN